MLNEVRMHRDCHVPARVLIAPQASPSAGAICCMVCQEGSFSTSSFRDRDLISRYGSGKTSLIHSLAGELGLDIYVVSLSSKGSGLPPLNAFSGSDHFFSIA